MSHAGLQKSLVDFRMAIRARLGTDISIIGHVGLGVDGTTFCLSGARAQGARTQQEHWAREQKRRPWQSGTGVSWSGNLLPTQAATPCFDFNELK